MSTIQRKDFENYLNDFLNISLFQDYGPNGLQIQGKEEIQKIAFAVSATRDSIEKACSWGADALVVHHGLFWKFHGAKTLTGAFKKRVFPLVKNDINLFGYHLPLDAHKEIGNAAQIAKRLKLENQSSFGEYKKAPLGIKGDFPKPWEPEKLRSHLEEILGHSILHSSPGVEKIKSMGIITGGANSEWALCLGEGLDSYLTGEMSEHDWNEAKESGIHFFAGGHHATERFGIMALKEHIEEIFGVLPKKTLFIDSENPA